MLRLQGDATRTGVLLIRVWCDSADETLRGRITSCLDIGRSRDEVTDTAGTTAIEEVVREWLDRFASGAG